MATSYQDLADNIRNKQNQRKLEMERSHNNNDEYQKPRIDGNGFERSASFNFELYNSIMSDYLVVLARRATRWQKLWPSSNQRQPKRSATIKRYIRKGVPDGVRKQVWMFASGADKLMKQNKGVYRNLLSKADNADVISSVEKDLFRTYPDNIHFRRDSDDSKCEQLYDVLIVYGHYNKGVGYCQGLNYIAAMLLLVIKDEESTFWLLVALTMNLLPNYYSKGLNDLIVDQAVFDKLLSKKLPDLHAHLKSHGVDVPLFATKWFICLFADVLPSETVLRLWDAFFYEGSKIIFRAALTIMIKLDERLRSKDDLASILEIFKSIAELPEFLNCHQFIAAIFEIPNPLSMDTIKQLRQECAKPSN
ncbi:Growth hormone-regulated TBC protein 1-A [Trichoplax sp. H2]|uniref:Growth hormone-regulated TBC protein 1 n=1 Tax=Trichoplax adhaerens TaxID=10228 RepID=B3RJ65_TRIAD|nr:hypothetical protein TRIADDRAFT_51426 [Trichoplax adhaerens]EDV28477.1 hypothetical protein TRIADDRAFT_51426 [Trichoplax adhaerens]RDD39245.1 Growth hormone-regulated TBC protein 1-A [Trichoplax sp. H2]|eukprot:XP_002107679.1 hypothetical protein TRIADDRAFT_51426 [Trichoplax adhaerens]